MKSWRDDRTADEIILDFIAESESEDEDRAMLYAAADCLGWSVCSVISRWKMLKAQMGDAG